MTREALAHHAGLTFGSLVKIELAQSGPTWTNFRRIADALGLSITRLAAAVEAAEDPLIAPPSGDLVPPACRGSAKEARRTPTAFS